MSSDYRHKSWVGRCRKPELNYELTMMSLFINSYIMVMYHNVMHMISCFVYHNYVCAQCYYVSCTYEILSYSTTLLYILHYQVHLCDWSINWGLSLSWHDLRLHLRDWGIQCMYYDDKLLLAIIIYMHCFTVCMQLLEMW